MGPTYYVVFLICGIDKVVRLIPAFTEEEAKLIALEEYTTIRLAENPKENFGLVLPSVLSSHVTRRDAVKYIDGFSRAKSMFN